MITGIDSTDIKSFSYEETAISDKKITGVCEFGKFSIELFNDNNKYSNLEKQWLPSMFGDIFINKANPDQATMTIKLEGYDSRYKLDKEYNEKLYSFPMTLRNYRNKVFEDSNLNYKDDDTFPNEDLVINFQPYIGDNPTNRDAIKWISQAGLSIVEKDFNDIFYFDWFDNENIFEVEDSIDLTTNSKATNPINLMVLGRGDVEDNVYYPIVAPNDKHEFRIDNNYILDPQDASEGDKRYSVIQPLYQRILGFSYVTYNMRTTFIENKLDIKLGSKIEFYNRTGDKLESYVMSKTITYLGSDYNNPDNYEVTLSAEEIAESNTDISYGSSILDDVRNVQRTADKINGIINDVVEEVGQYDNRISKVEQTVDKISQSVDEVVNFNREITSKNIIIRDAMEFYPLSIHVKGYSRPIEWIWYPSNNLFPSANIYPSVDRQIENIQNLTLCIANKDTVKEFLIDVQGNLRSLGNIYDELFIEFDKKDNSLKGRIIRRLEVVNHDLKVLAEPVEEELEMPIMRLFEGYNHIYFKETKDYEITLSYLINSDQNEIYATKVEMNSSITQTANEIKSTVTKTIDDLDDKLSSEITQNAENIKLKVSQGEISSELSLEKGAINLKGNRVTIQSDKTTLDANGKLTCSDIAIVGGQFNISQDASNTRTPIILSQVYNGSTYRGQMGGAGTSYYRNGTTGVQLLVNPNNGNGTLYLYNTGNTNEYNYVTPTGVRTTSDIRYKDNINNINEDISLNIINNLTPITYNYVGSEEVHRGLSAQEVKTVLNDQKIKNQIYSLEYNDINKDERYTLNYSELIPDLINVCKYLNNKVEKLEKRIIELENGVDNNG